MCVFQIILRSWKNLDFDVPCFDKYIKWHHSLCHRYAQGWEKKS